MSTTYSQSDISLNRHAHLRTRSPAGQPSNPAPSSPPSSGHLPIHEHADHHQPSGERGRTRNRPSNPEFTPPRQHDRYLQDNLRIPNPPSATSSAFTVHDRSHHHPALQQQHHEHNDSHLVQHNRNLGPILPQDHAPSSYHTYQIDHHYEEHHQTVLFPKMPPVLPPPGSIPGSGSGFVSGIEAVANSALTLANNIAFRPLTTSQPAKCSKLKIRIFFDSTIFQAGGNLFGRMEVTATSSRSLKLGEIAVELAAYEGECGE